MRKLWIVATIFATALTASGVAYGGSITVAPQLTVAPNTQINVAPKIINSTNNAVSAQVGIGLTTQIQALTSIGGIITARENAVNVVVGKTKIGQ